MPCRSLITLVCLLAGAMGVCVSAVVADHSVNQPFLPEGASAEAGRAVALVEQPRQAAVPNAQESKKLDEYKMVTYHAVFVTKGPKWTDSPTADAQPLVTAHRNYLRQLLTTGQAVVAGGLSGPPTSTLTAMYILTGTPERAKEIAAADPGVQDGRWSVEILQWMGPEGWFAKPADSLQAETLYFGFLINGPNRTQDEETAKELQRAHLDYMTGQSNMGKLVMAGPLLDGGARRGLVAYRVPTMKEAVDRASADPMVRAGRLAVELYAWSIPKGILK